MPAPSRLLRLVALWAVFFWLTVPLGLAHGQQREVPAKDSRPSPKIDEDLRRELLRRLKEDQEARKQFLERTGRRGQTDPAEAKKQGKDPEVKKLHELDRKNTARMKEIVAKYGWPGKSLAGTDGAHAAWLLVQHADLDRPFQKHCLDLLREAFKKGETTGEKLAYLTDRVLVGENKKQRYGTQYQQRDGQWVPHPIEDEANVDQRRKEVGLSTLAEYDKQLKQAYQAKGTNK